MPMILCYDHYGTVYQFEESQFINRKAVYGLYRNGEKILLVKDAKSNTWEIPGGGKKSHESDGACLKREFFEETGLIIKEVIHLYSQDQTFFYDKASEQPWKTLRKFFIVTNATGNLKSNGNNADISEACYFNKSELSTIKIQTSTLAILNNFYSPLNR
jgi:ADP-ribose pyrophosphatase YjhB (NUDIX family)